MIRRPLTESQDACLRLIRARIASRGAAPTLGELARARSVSRAAVAEMLGWIEKKGYIAREKYTARGIRVLP